MSLLNIFKKKKKPEMKAKEKNTPIEVKEEAKISAQSHETESMPVPENTNPITDQPDKVESKTSKKPAEKSEPAPKAEHKTKINADVKPKAKLEVNPEVENVDAVAVDTTKYTGRFEINKSKDGKKFFFNLYASNKVGIATSQMYSSAQSALIGIKSVIANAADAPIEDQSLKKYDTLPYPKWEIYIDNGGKYRFRLNASNGSCVCHSQGYTTKTACKNGIDSIIRSSRNAEIDKTYLTK